MRVSEFLVVSGLNLKVSIFCSSTFILYHKVSICHVFDYQMTLTRKNMYNRVGDQIAIEIVYCT